MSRKRKFYLFSLFFIVLGALSYYLIVRKTFSEDNNSEKKYRRLLKDSLLSRIDTNYCYSFSKDGCVLSLFNTQEKNTSIYIWDIESVRKMNINNIKFVRSSNDFFDIGKGETMFVRSSPEFKVPFDIVFNHHLNVYISKHSNILDTFDFGSKKGVYGKIKMMSFSDNRNTPIIANLENEDVFTMAFVYKSHIGTFLIMVVSYDYIDKAILDSFQ